MNAIWQPGDPVTTVTTTMYDHAEAVAQLLRRWPPPRSWFVDLRRLWWPRWI